MKEWGEKKNRIPNLMFSVAPISQNNLKSSSTNRKGCASLIQVEIFEFLSLQIREIYQDSRIQFIFFIFLHFSVTKQSI
jgi:hypothetical protein